MNKRILLTFQAALCGLCFGLYMESFVLGCGVYFGLVTIGGAIRTLGDV